MIVPIILAVRITNHIIASMIPSFVLKISAVLTQLIALIVTVERETLVRISMSVLLPTIVNKIAPTQLVPILVPVCQDSLWNQITSHVSQESNS